MRRVRGRCKKVKKAKKRVVHRRPPFTG
jgi:hypothetical protein